MYNMFTYTTTNKCLQCLIKIMYTVFLNNWCICRNISCGQEERGARLRQVPAVIIAVIIIIISSSSNIVINSFIVVVISSSSSNIIIDIIVCCMI